MNDTSAAPKPQIPEQEEEAVGPVTPTSFRERGGTEGRGGQRSARGCDLTVICNEPTTWRHQQRPGTLVAAADHRRTPHLTAAARVGAALYTTLVHTTRPPLPLVLSLKNVYDLRRI
jgi:hypothetical protein